MTYNPKASYDKRIEFMNALFDHTDYLGTANEWLEERGFIMEDVTEEQLDKFIKEFTIIDEATNAEMGLDNA